MSMYGESPYNEEKNYLYNHIRDFLNEHPVSELMGIISNVLEYEKEHDGILDAICKRKENGTN